ncbi:Late embryogenesis abundant protein [Quillaja saponaria]|uniref:Late embryogenesis abundant protein n=1 Tax=Quillaja saponaria TaxID=32244 RepID=A0AAD7Q2B8_QUISA|nr:Late embryogenesis abundant protein [Quillaja saponaria]
MACCSLIITSSIIVLLSLTLCIGLVVFLPQNPKFYVTDASLSQFDYTNKTIQYSMALNITIRNPSMKFTYDYTAIEGNAFYLDQRFSTQNVSVWKPPYVNKGGKSFSMHTVFRGQQVLNLSDTQISLFNKEKDNGSYAIVMRFILFLDKLDAKVFCGLKVPLAANNGSANRFKNTKCKFVK